MATLDTPTMSMYSDPTTSVILTGFTAKSQQSTVNGVMVQLEGSSRPRLLRGGGGTGQWSITGIFARDEGSLAASLKNLLLLQETANDPRMVLIPGGKMAATITRPLVVVCLDHTDSIIPAAGIYQFEMTLQESA